MNDINRLIGEFARRELEMQRNTFLAPRVAGASVRTRICGLAHTFKVVPDDFSGWGIFRPENAMVAALLEPAGRAGIDSYLELFPRIALRLVAPLNNGGSWLASPANRGDPGTRIQRENGVTVHLVEEGDRFDMIFARWDGTAFWFQRRDFTADPLMEEYLRGAFAEDRSPAELAKKGLTPDDRRAYELAYWSECLAPENLSATDRRRIRQALQRGGGTLIDLVEAKRHWRVEWATSNGERHCSIISKGNLTVIGAGICLSGEDRKFDLQSLVGVVEHRPSWMRGG